MNDKEKIFLSVLESHKGIIFKVAHTYCQHDSDKDDLIQEITVQIWLSIEQYNDQYKWSTLIYKIALNTAISFYRKNRTRKENTVGLSPIIEFPQADESGGEDEDLLLLRKCIRELKEIDRAVILLHLDGLTTKEIAKIIDTTQTNVTTKISRIKDKLREKFKEYKAKNYGKH